MIGVVEGDEALGVTSGGEDRPRVVDPDHLVAGSVHHQERAAEAGSEGARLNMVHFHEMGIGTKKDLAKATEWQARLKR